MTTYQTTCDQDARALAHQYIHGDRVHVIRRIEGMDPYRSRAVVALMASRYLNQSARSFVDTIVLGAKHTDPTEQPAPEEGSCYDDVFDEPSTLCDDKCDRCNLDG